jgi:hypothetical protein
MNSYSSSTTSADGIYGYPQKFMRHKKVPYCPRLVAHLTMLKLETLRPQLHLSSPILAVVFKGTFLDALVNLMEGHR